MNKYHLLLAISILNANSHAMLKQLCCQGIESEEKQNEYSENVISNLLEDIIIKRSENKIAQLKKIIHNESIKWEHAVIDESNCITLKAEKKYTNFGNKTVILYEWNIRSKKPGHAIIKLLRKKQNTIVEEQIINVIVTH